MKPEDKAAIKAAGATLLVVGALATIVANPVAWGAAALGAYRMGKLAHKHSKDNQPKDGSGSDHDLFI
jgi:hypothetical protein